MLTRFCCFLGSQVLGWAPCIKLATGLEKTYRWIKTQIEADKAAVWSPLERRLPIPCVWCRTRLPRIPSLKLWCRTRLRCCRRNHKPRACFMFTLVFNDGQCGVPTTALICKREEAQSASVCTANTQMRDTRADLPGARQSADCNFQKRISSTPQLTVTSC